MRAPNGEECCLGSSLASSLEFALIMAGSTVGYCDALFECSVKTGTSVTFEFQNDELALLEQFYPRAQNDHERVKRVSQLHHFDAEKDAVRNLDNSVSRRR